jgi:hypothetical protein
LSAPQVIPIGEGKIDAHAKTPGKPEKEQVWGPLSRLYSGGFQKSRPFASSSGMMPMSRPVRRMDLSLAVGLFLPLPYYLYNYSNYQYQYFYPGYNTQKYAELMDVFI